MVVTIFCIFPAPGGGEFLLVVFHCRPPPPPGEPLITFLYSIMANFSTNLSSTNPETVPEEILKRPDDFYYFYAVAHCVDEQGNYAHPHVVMALGKSSAAGKEAQAGVSPDVGKPMNMAVFEKCIRQTVKDISPNTIFNHVCALDLTFHEFKQRFNAFAGKRMFKMAGLSILPLPENYDDEVREDSST